MKKQIIPARVYDGAMSVADAAKEIGIGRKAIFDWFVTEKICSHDGRSYIANQQYIDQGWFKIKHNTWWSGGNEYNLQTVFVTEKGIEEIRKRLPASGLAPQLNLKLTSQKGGTSNDQI